MLCLGSIGMDQVNCYTKGQFYKGSNLSFILLHSGWPKLYRALASLSDIGLKSTVSISFIKPCDRSNAFYISTISTWSSLIYIRTVQSLYNAMLGSIGMDHVIIELLYKGTILQRN